MLNVSRSGLTFSSPASSAISVIESARDLLMEEKVLTDIGSIDSTEQERSSESKLHVTLSSSATAPVLACEGLTVPEASVPAVEI